MQKLERQRKVFPSLGKHILLLFAADTLSHSLQTSSEKEKIPKKHLLVEVLCCCILIAVDFHKSRWNFKLLSTPESARNHEGTNIASNIFISMEIKMTLSIKSTMDSTKAVLNKYLKDCSGIVMRPINGLWQCIANIASHRIARMVDKLLCSFFSWIFKIYTFSATIDWPFRKF